MLLRSANNVVFRAVCIGPVRVWCKCGCRKPAVDWGSTTFRRANKTNKLVIAPGYDSPRTRRVISTILLISTKVNIVIENTKQVAMRLAMPVARWWLLLVVTSLESLTSLH